MARAEAVHKRKANALNQGSNRPKQQQRTDDKVASPELAQHAGAAAPSDSWAVQQREYTTLILLCHLSFVPLAEMCLPSQSLPVRRVVDWGDVLKVSCRTCLYAFYAFYVLGLIYHYLAAATPTL